MKLPKCGLYKTTEALGPIPSSRLVYFHNHGNPGAGVYLPEAWNQNRARFQKQGHVLSDESKASTLISLPNEGFYRVEKEFTCCEKNCRVFEEDALIQIGYDAEANAIAFVPRITQHGLALPERGSRLLPDRFDSLKALKVSVENEKSDLVH